MTAAPLERSGRMERARCVHRSKRSQERCKNDPVPGLDACYFHCGLSREAARVKGQANLDAVAWGQVDTASLMDPSEVVLRSVTMWHARQRLLARAVQRKVEELGLEAVVGTTLWRVEAEASDRAMKASAFALGAGLAERQVRAWEQMADSLVGLLTRFAVRLGLDANDPRVIDGAVAELRGLAGGESE